MAITRRSVMDKQQATPSSSLPPPHPEPNNVVPESTTTTTTTTKVSEYEQTREQRIKENRERLQKLGIVDLSLQLKSMSSNAVTRRTPKSQFDRKTPLKSPALGPTEPRRRSSRLQNAPPVTYVEVKEEKSRKSRDIVMEEGSKPEFYTEEDEKLLGSTEMPWTMFVDGYDANGTRIYDSVNGKTCHQCRQKTLGQRTRCSQCNLVQGQFCGDCLYMRYGEHVVEANQNPAWLCPPCRGICNCSLCRQAKGWPATGALYRRISSLGYKSVAHYLMETKRAPPNVDAVSDTQQSAKRVLPFEGMEVPSGNESDDKAPNENDESDDKVPDENGESGVLSEINATLDTEPNQTSKGVRRSGRSKKENASADGKAVTEGQGAEEDPVPDKQTPEGVRRSGRRSNKENANVGEVPVANDVPIPENKSLKVVGRPRKRSKKENLDAGEESVSKDVTENGPVSQGPEVPNNVTDSIARRLRSRTST